MSCPAIGSRAIVTTHIGDLKTYALSTPGTENAAVEFDDETLQPKYRLHIGDIGQSNALKIARHLKLPEHIIGRAESYRAERRGGEIPELEILQQLRKEAEQAREGALRAQAEAERTREALNRRLADLQDETRQAETMSEARARLQPGDRVVVPRLGYDRPGRLVKLDPRKKTRRRRHRARHVGCRRRRAHPPDDPHAGERRLQCGPGRRCRPGRPSRWTSSRGNDEMKGRELVRGSFPGSPIMDMHEFDKNRLAFPPEELLQYRGKDIAWSPDGKQVIASDTDFLRLYEAVKALGYDPSEVLFSTVPDADAIYGLGAMGE